MHTYRYIQPLKSYDCKIIRTYIHNTSSLKTIVSIEIENFRQLIASYMYTLQANIHTCIHTYIRNDLCHGDAEGLRLTLVDGDVERLLTVSPQPLRDDGVKLSQSIHTLSI